MWYYSSNQERPEKEERERKKGKADLVLDRESMRYLQAKVTNITFPQYSKNLGYRRNNCFRKIEALGRLLLPNL